MVLVSRNVGAGGEEKSQKRKPWATSVEEESEREIGGVREGRPGLLTFATTFVCRSRQRRLTAALCAMPFPARPAGYGEEGSPVDRVNSQR